MCELDYRKYESPHCECGENGECVGLCLKEGRMTHPSENITEIGREEGQSTNLLDVAEDFLSRVGNYQ